MHVLQATEYFLPDVERGIERFVFELSKSLQLTGDRVTVITGSRTYRPELDGMELAHVAMPGGLAMSMTKGAYDRRLYFTLSCLMKMRSLHFDVAHAHHFAGGYAAYLNKIATGRPYIMTVHVMPGASALASPVPIYRKMFKIASANAGAVISVSNTVADAVEKSLGVESTVIPHCVDINRYKPADDKPALKKSLGLDDVPVILMVASLSDRRKRPEMLIKAMPYILRVIPDAKLVLAGNADGGTMYRLEGIANKMGIRKHVTVTGRISDEMLPAYYAASDLFALPSKDEAAGLVLLEAMASGVPVVGSDSGGIPEYIDSGVNGSLFSAGSVESLAQEIKVILDDKRLASMLGKAGRKLAVERHSWEAAAKSYSAVYETVVKA